jgi:hypothetical protein
MMLKGEKHTPTAVAFNIDIGAPLGAGQIPQASGEVPLIKKRLEAYGTEEIVISREQIAMKLKRAEEKRKQALLNRSGASSPIVAEKRRRAAREKKRAIDEGNLK